MNLFMCKISGGQLQTMSPGNVARAVSVRVTAASTFSSRASLSGLPPPGPVLTFLSPNPYHSQSAVKVLNQLFDFPLLDLNEFKRVGGVGRNNDHARDSLDKLHFGDSIVANVMKWDSKVCICPSSGTILHLLSLSKDDETRSQNSHSSPEELSKHKLSLISIHGGDMPSTVLAEAEQIKSTSEEKYLEVILEARKRLAEAMQSQQFFTAESENVGEKNGNNSSSTSFASTVESKLRGLLFQLTYSVGKQASVSFILSKNPLSSRPISTIIDLKPSKITNLNELTQQNDSCVVNRFQKSKLREVALPFFPELSDCTTEFSRSSLTRPLPGIYQCPIFNCQINQPMKDSRRVNGRNTTSSNPGLIFRPLPAATEDMRLPPPSFVFQCQSMTETQALLEGTLGGKTAKIGWRGDGAGGSLMVSHPALAGIDIRISNGNENGDWILSSCFDEAQESLLAGSLDELQSAHVISEGASNSDTQDESILERDSNIGNADCWVEVRANVKHPTGFWKQFSPRSIWNEITGKSKKTGKVAKPPDLPYE